MAVVKMLIIFNDILVSAIKIEFLGKFYLFWKWIENEFEFRDGIK